MIRSKAALFAQRFRRSDVGVEDLEEEIACHLLMKADKYDPARASILGFVIVVLNSWFKTRVRYIKRKRRGAGRQPISLDTPVAGCKDDARTVGEMLGDTDGKRRTGGSLQTVPEAVETCEIVAAVLGQLSPEERLFVLSVYDLGVAGAARKHKLTRRQAQRRMDGIRARFRHLQDLSDGRAAPEETA